MSEEANRASGELDETVVEGDLDELLHVVWNGPEGKLPLAQVVRWWQDLAEGIPPEHRESAECRFHRLDFEGGVTVRVVYRRPETAEEREKRLGREERRRETARRNRLQQVRDLVALDPDLVRQELERSAAGKGTPPSEDRP